MSYLQRTSDTPDIVEEDPVKESFRQEQGGLDLTYCNSVSYPQYLEIEVDALYFSSRDGGVLFKEVPGPVSVKKPTLYKQPYAANTGP